MEERSQSLGDEKPGIEVSRFAIVSMSAWEKVCAVYATLAPVRFSVGIIGVLFFVFFWVEQGIDILCALGGSSSESFGWAQVSSFYHYLEIRRLLGFFGGLFIFSVTNWYWPRFLLNCRFPMHIDGSGLKPKTDDWLRLQVPRILGVLPAIVLAGCFVHAGWSRETNSVGDIILATGCLILAVILYVGFILRRKWLALLKPAPRYGSLREVKTDKMALAGLAIFTGASCLALIGFTCWPVLLGLRSGPCGVLFLAFAGWVSFVSIAIYGGHRYRLPILTLFAILGYFSSHWNDNHALRGLSVGEDRRPTVDQRLDFWHTEICRCYPTEPNHPLFIVAAEGGGIRAAYWTAIVLGNLQDKAGTNFSDHLFAMSGVSGGSLGAVTFSALLSRLGVTNYQSAVRDVLNQQFLAPLLGKMLFADLIQRFIPFRWQALDRASALEQGWEHSDTDARLNDFFTNRFSSVDLNAPNGKMALPALFLNGTEVESGRRIITCNLRFTNGVPGTFVGAIDGLDEMRGQGIRISTAIHSSARFTYFSPAGRFLSGNHVVDGGYFENYGAETAHDILNAVIQKGWTNVRPVLIVVRNDVESANRLPNTNRAAHETFVPMVTLLNTRGAHASFALAELSNACVSIAPKKCRPDFFTYNLERRNVVLPLGWALSSRAITEMESQLNTNPNFRASTNIIGLCLSGGSKASITHLP